MPPRRSGKITGSMNVAKFHSNSRSSRGTNSPPPSSILSFESSEIAIGMKTSLNKELTLQTEDSSFATASTHELREETLASVSPGKLNVVDEAQEKLAASLGLKGLVMNRPDSVENSVSLAKKSIEGDTGRIGKSDTKTVSEGGKKKLVKKKVKVMKVVKRMVPKLVVKGSLKTELAEKKEKNPPMILPKHNENSGSMTSVCTMEAENGEPVPISSNSIKTDNINLSKTVPLEVEGDILKESIDDSMGVEKVNPSVDDGHPIPISFDSIKTDDINLSKIAPLEAGGESLKESIVDSMGVEKVNPSCEDTKEGESIISSGVSTSGITLDFSSDDKMDVMKEEKIESQVNNQDLGSFEKKTSEKFEDLSVVPAEYKICAGNEFVENSGVELNRLVPVTDEMEALVRMRKRKREIFIGRLNKNVKEEDIRKVFEQVGEVEEVRLTLDPKTKKARGFGFLRFASAADAKEALEKYSDVEICGKKCDARLVDGSDTLFLGNIDKQWKSDDVLELVKKAGVEGIDCVNVKDDPRNPEQNRGFAVLELKTIKDAKFAFNKLQSDLYIKKKKIAVSWAQPLMEPSEEEVLKVKAVYAECLPSSWDEKKVRDFFRKFGEIESITLGRDLPSSKRKDIAFVNYTSRENALACIEAFNHDQIDYDGSKVTVKVSLAKRPSTKKTRHSSLSTGKELLESKPKIMKSMLTVHESRTNWRPTGSSRNSFGVDRNMSTNDELIQLLRQQASGSYDLNPGYPLVGNKRPLSAVEHYPPPLNPRGHPRMRSETAYHTTGDASGSAFGHPSRILPMPLSRDRNTGYTDRSGHGIQDYQHFQTTGRLSYFDRGDPYRRY